MTNRKIYKASGFTDRYGGQFWSNDKSKYGVRYQCKTCGKITLGWYGNGAEPQMHLTTCTWLLSKTSGETP